MPRKYILDAETVSMKLERMAYELVENNLDEKEILLVGIRDHGAVIAKTIEAHVRAISSLNTKLITLQLDKRVPREVELSEQVAVDGRVVVIVDDVASTGKTMLYSLKPFLEFHPRKIQTLALVARTHKAFPIELDYVGLLVATTLQEHIYVEVGDDRVTGAYLE